MRCVVCGSDAVIEGMCVKCYLERRKIVELDKVTLIKCPRCESFRLHGRWKYVDFHTALMDSVCSNIRVHPDFSVEDVSIEPLSKGEVGKYTVRLSGYLSGEFVTTETVFRVEVQTRVCTRCSREAGGYYESIVQIRADGRKLESDEIETVKDVIKNVLEREKDNQKAFLSKIVERKEGFDFYFGDRNIGKKVSKAIVDRLGGKIVESKKLHTRIDGQNAYRFTYSVRLPCYREGDVVLEGDELCVVTNTKLGRGVALSDWSDVNLKNPKVVVRREDLMNSVVVNYDDFVVEILDENMRVVQAKKPAVNLRIGDEVFAFEYGGVFYVIPFTELPKGLDQILKGFIRSQNRKIESINEFR
jgi:nonsense-mediated mRNA decay protein 3